MGVSTDFSTFCSNLSVDNSATISSRYHTITTRLNLDFWATDSDTLHSLYVGSYGRDSAIRGVSDIDIIFELPNSLYHKYDAYTGNGQSALLQSVRASILQTYPSTDIGADGQVVAVSFQSMTFEVVPAFINKDGSSFTYPDANAGGQWRLTNPRPEIQAINDMNLACNHNLKRLCRMARAWKNQHDAPMGGLLIDTFAHNFIRSWQYSDKSYTYYDWMMRDFFSYISQQDTTQQYWLAVGSNQRINRKGLFEYKAKSAFNTAKEAIALQLDASTSTYDSRRKWRQIFGTTYPS